MTVVRRILIGVVGLLLLLDVAALGIVKFGTGPAPSKEKTKVAIWIDDKGQAEAATKMLAENGPATKVAASRILMPASGAVGDSGISPDYLAAQIA